MARDVIIFDTTLRDGEQAPGNSMTPEAKLRLASQLDALGVDVIEAGFPSASQGDQQAVRAVAEAVRRSAVAALARCHDRDIDLAGEALRPAARPRVHVFIATSDLHLEQKLKISRDDCVARAEAAIRRARRYTDDVEFSAEDATRTDLEFLCRVVEAAIAAGATTVNLPDTVGYALPGEYGAMFRAVRARVPTSDRVVFSAHCHDDLGLAVANSLAAIEAGAGQVECTINGIGERAGNARCIGATRSLATSSTRRRSPSCTTSSRPWQTASARCSMKISWRCCMAAFTTRPRCTGWRTWR